MNRRQFFHSAALITAGGVAVASSIDLTETIAERSYHFLGNIFKRSPDYIVNLFVAEGLTLKKLELKGHWDEPIHLSQSGILDSYITVINHPKVRQLEAAGHKVPIWKSQFLHNPGLTLFRGESITVPQLELMVTKEI